MTERIQDAYKHCFSHICRNGAAHFTSLKLEEIFATYTDAMIKDLADCGVTATAEEVREFIAEQYKELKKIEAVSNAAADMLKM